MSEPTTLSQVKGYVSQVAFNDWEFKVTEEGRIYILQICCPNGKDNVTGEPYAWTSRKWRLSSWMTKSEVIQTCFKAVLTALEHEAREQFLYNGVSIFDPHYDVDALFTLRVSGQTDERLTHKT